MNANGSKRFSALAAAALLFGPLLGCDSDSAGPEPVQTETLTMAVSEVEVILDVGETVALTAQVVNENQEPQSVRLVWESSNAAVASVGPTGVVEALTPGNATVRVRSLQPVGGSGMLQQEVMVRVRNDAASVLVVPSGPFELRVGETLALEAVVRNAEGTVVDRRVMWFSDRLDVASVDPEGTVAAVGTGLAMITAEAGTGVTFGVLVSVVPPKSNVDG